MRRTVVALLLVAGLLAPALPAHAGTGRSPAPASPAAMQAEAAALQGPARDAVNNLIRFVVPLVCPAIARFAAPAYQGFVTGGCASIVNSTDPIAVVFVFLPTICAGSPPLGTQVFPSIAPIIVATCPLLMKLVDLLQPLIG